MSVLFITPKEITTTTILGGNVDPDRYIFCIEEAQKAVIEPLLGTELYDVIYEGAKDGNLTGDYLELYTKYIKPIVKNEALAEYIEIASLMVSNGGVFKHAPENSEIVSQKEVQTLSQRYHNLAQLDITRFNKWICKHNIPEYKRYQDEVNAINVNTRSGWYFGNDTTRHNDWLKDTDY